MLILFNIHYMAPCTDELFVNVKNADGSVEAHRMTQWQDGCWRCELRFEPKEIGRAHV